MKNYSAYYKKSTNSDLKVGLKNLCKEIYNNGIALLAVNREKNTGVHITEEFVKKCKKAKIWNTPALLSTLENCWYGVDVTRIKSPGGKDGIFSIDRNYRPRNNMQKEVFDKFIDKEGSLFNYSCSMFDVNKEDTVAIRVVSHHMRLVGVLFRKEHESDLFINHILLVGFDNKK